MALPAELRIAWLLRTYDDACTSWHAGAGGGGVILMPSQWGQGSYAELERRLGDLRDSGGRALWWHVTRRYRYGTEQRLVVPLRSLSGGRDATPILPANARLVADSERDEKKRARVVAYVWDARVNERLAGLGLEQLARRMYRGDRGRIVVPPDVLAAVAGRSP